MFGGQSSKGQKGVTGGAQTDDSTAKIAAAEVAGKHKHHPNLHSGIGLIYFGPMTVNSRAHDVSMKDGECKGFVKPDQSFQCWVLSARRQLLEVCSARPQLPTA
jgi:hypothetical protein